MATCALGPTGTPCLKAAERPEAQGISVNSHHSTFAFLDQGEITSCELTPVGSNYTFLIHLQLGDHTGRAIYKPKDGEVPLWDFPAGTLYKRECAAYLLSEVLDWNVIPVTIIREGPYGIGSVQQYVEHNPRQNYHSLTEANADELRVIACFDLVANNTDRKAAHVLMDPSGKLWGIDQGLTFHVDTKIRTVIWDFSDEPIPDRLIQSLTQLCLDLRNPSGRLQELLDLLNPQEVEALHKRLEWVLAERAYPGVPGRRRRR